MTVMERKIDTEIILSPLAAKELANWLGEHIKDYEKLFGEIKRPGSGSNGVSQSRERQRVRTHPGLYVRRHEYQRESADSQRHGQGQEVRSMMRLWRSSIRVLATNPEIAEAWNNKGVALYGLGRSEEALQSYDRCLSTDPENLDALRNKGFLLRGQKKLEEALQVYDQRAPERRGCL